MSQTTIAVIVVVVAVIIIALIAVLAWQRSRLCTWFGPEYDRAVDERGSTVAAERELLGRERPYRRLDIKPLPEEARIRYADRWRGLQEQFVDSPGDAVLEADQLVTSLMRERGYETTGYDRQLEDLSVEHPRCLATIAPPTRPATARPDGRPRPRIFAKRWCTIAWRRSPSYYKVTRATGPVRPTNQSGVDCNVA
jgi:hypothetical protein